MITSKSFLTETQQQVRTDSVVLYMYAHAVRD